MKAKRIFSVLLAALMVLTLMPMMVLADGESSQEATSGQSGMSGESGEQGGSGTGGGGEISVMPVGGKIGDNDRSDGGYVYMGGIKWHVIGESSKSWLLISAGVLNRPCTWDEAKRYCDTVYKEKFSELEQSAVLATTKKDEYPLPNYQRADLDDDKLFLLSATEANGYFDSDENRKPGCWWLRSPSYDDAYDAGVVRDGGSLDICHVSNDDDYGVRPAFQLNLESVLFTSAAEGGKPSPGSGFAAYTVPTTETDRKLTLIDDSRSDFAANVADANSVTVAPGGSLAVSYSGAGTGDGEYVSAMLCDANGNVMYYASLTPDSSGSGTWNMTIPDELAQGSYTLKVFSEQQNGNNETDYVSEPVEITLTISDSTPKTYAVTVNSGSGSGAYAEGTSVEITANEPEPGKQFKGWTASGITLTDEQKSSANLTFTMPAQAVELTATYEDVKDEPEFKAHSLILSGQIGMNFYMQIPEEYQTGTMTFTIKNEDTLIRTTEPVTGTVQNDGRYLFTCHVNSIEMADTITATFSYGDSQTKTDTTSVQDYLTYIIGNSNDAACVKATPLAKAIWNYGYYAQQSLPGGPKHTALPNTYIGEVNLITSLTGYAVTADLGSNVTEASYSLDLDSETAINLFLTTAEELTKDNVTVTAPGGTTFDYSVEKVSSRYCIQITGIGAHELGSTFTVTAADATITASALSYVQQAMSNNSMGEKDKNTAAALYGYFNAANNYKNS